MADVAIDLPIYNTPIIDARGNISEVWWRFFQTLLTRTGGSSGVDISNILELIRQIFLDLNELSIGAGTAENKAIQANDAISQLSLLLDTLAQAPPQDQSRIDSMESAVRAIDELSGTAVAKANQALASIAEVLRLFLTDAGSALAKANQVGDSLQGIARILELDGGNAMTAAGRVADALQVLSRNIELATSNPQVQTQRSLSLDYIDWDQQPAYFQQTARMAWNTADDTLNLHHSDGVTQQMGQELYGRITNNTGAIIPNGVCLGINPATNSYVLFIANGSLSPITIVGVTTQAIAIGAQGRITVWGRVRDIDTTGAPYGETWTAGQVLYVSPTIAGGFTNVKPTAPRLSLPIAQVMTVSATTGQIAVRPTVEQQLFYGQFVKTTDQVPSAINTAQALTWDSALIANGVSIGAPTSRIVVANAGLYKFSVSLQLTSSSASVKNVYLWFRKNGVDVPNSTLISSLDSATAIRAPSRSLFFSMAAGDYIEIMFACDSTAMTVDNIAATAFSPAAPAATLSVNQEQQ
jgi:hypothetical protein